MKRLSNRENEIMEYFWSLGDMFVKDLLAQYPEPKPHFNTLSTEVRTLESYGFLSHRTYGNTYQYYPIVTKEEYRNNAIGGVVSNLFSGSYLDAVSAFVKEEKISVEELTTLIEQVNKTSK